MTPITHSPITFRRLLLICGNTLLVLGFCAYIVFQARFLLQGPVVTLTETPPLAQSERTVTLTGNAKNIVSLSLNGRDIFTDVAGDFNETLVLENSVTVATITARDRYGRERAYEQKFVYTGNSTFNQSL